MVFSPHIDYFSLLLATQYFPSEKKAVNVSLEHTDNGLFGPEVDFPPRPWPKSDSDEHER